MKTNLTENSVLRQRARASLAGKWGLAVGITALYMAISIIASSMRHPAGTLLSLLISGPLAVGMATFALSISRNKEANIEQLFTGFKKYGRSLVAYLLIVIFVLLWALLLIVPGIIAALSYVMTYFILVDDETISAHDAIKKSKKMMYGHKWKCFRLALIFICWGILSIFTLGIGFLWLIPYIQVTMAKFYDELKTSAEPALENASN
ncbi:MAG: DUF975 family protein [Candidatus Paceibacteria bacterium]